MGTIHELPRRATNDIPPELADLTRDGLQEYMLSTMRESLFSTFETSPEVVAVTIRRQESGRFWDIKLSCAYYHERDNPANHFTRYFWDITEADETMGGEMSSEGFDSAQEAYVAALAAIPVLVSQWAEDGEVKASTERFLMAGPDDEYEALT